MVTSAYSHPAFKVGDAKDIDLNSTILRNGSIEKVNLLSGLVPTFANWDTEPGTNADMVFEEYDRAITTHGACSIAATITYDLGSDKRIIVFTDNEFADMIMFAKSDASGVYRQCGLSSQNGVTSFAGVYRYLQLRVSPHADIAYIKNLAYLM